MEALVFENETLQVDSHYPEPMPGPRDALIKVSQAGLCNTDVELIKGYMGFSGILGHEFVGVVEACESAPQWVGRRVCADINAACGVCPTCVVLKDPHHCPNRSVIGIQNHGGAFAKYVVAPVANLYAVPERVSDEEAIFTEPLAAAFEILEQLPLAPEAKVVVQGDGKLGLLIAQVLRRACDTVILLGRHPEKMALLAETGVETRDGRDPAVIEQLGLWADVVVEVTGTAAGLQQAMALCKPRGTIVLKSTVAAGADINLAPIVINELTVLGSRCGPFGRTLEAMADRPFVLKPLIQGVYPLSRGVEAMEHAQRKGALKIMLTP